MCLLLVSKKDLNHLHNIIIENYVKATFSIFSINSIRIVENLTIMLHDL